MKKVLSLLMTAALLTGCGAQETFETVEDMIPVQPVAARQQFYAQLPEDAAAASFSGEDTGELYLCDSGTVTKQVFPAGDLENTLRSVTGQSKDTLQLLQTTQQECLRYDFVWTAAGETELELGRGCILDDGNYHYVLTAMTPESKAQAVRESWEDMFASCCLLDPGVDLNTGS